VGAHTEKVADSDLWISRVNIRFDHMRVANAGDIGERYF